jgi:monoamine oxidase
LKENTVMEENFFDVIVIGAGAAGLMAAWELVQAGKKTAIVEARDRIGGRIHTIQDPDFELPVELGAEFVHGNLELTQLVLKKAGVAFYEVKGGIWQNEDGSIEKQSDFVEDGRALEKKFRELKKDIPVAAFIENYLNGPEFEDLRFTLKNYVEGYYAGETTRASTFAVKEELTNSDYEQYRVEGGYIKMIDYLNREAAGRGARLFLSNPVEKIDWQQDKVEVMCDRQSFSGRRVLVTVPMGILQSEKIRFAPALPRKMAAARQLGFGPVVKTVLQFSDGFWKHRENTQGRNLNKLSFIFSRADIPTWWTYYPKDVQMITGWCGGPRVESLKGLGKEGVLQKALDSLSMIFQMDFLQLKQNLKAWHVADWTTDPYSCGAYSYDVVNGSIARAVLNEPVDNTVFFAGEGLVEGSEIGTVEAALHSGRDAARAIIVSLKN